jgi:NTP pyrophosphatase (non-canonical NTP hydrolase)
MPCDALTYLLVPACPRREQTYAGFEGLTRVVAALRAPDGCPWDREQTHESLKPHLLEETYETLEAIDRADPAELREELGDLLLQVLMHSQIASESGAFNIEQVVQHLIEKLIARHPHVFGDAHAETAAQVLKNWDATKRQQKGRESVLDGVPRSMPALARAQEISKRAARVGFEWDSIRRRAGQTARGRDRTASSDRVRRFESASPASWATYCSQWSTSLATPPGGRRAVPAPDGRSVHSAFSVDGGGSRAPEPPAGEPLAPTSGKRYGSRRSVRFANPTPAAATGRRLQSLPLVVLQA